MGRAVRIYSLTSARVYTSDRMAFSPSIRAMATAIGFRSFWLLNTLSQNASSRRILLMGLFISADCDMAISLRDSFPSRRHGDNASPTGVAGQLHCGALILLTLLGEVD